MKPLPYPSIFLSLLLAACGGGAEEQGASSATSEPASLQDASVVAAQMANDRSAVAALQPAEAGAAVPTAATAATAAVTTTAVSTTTPTTAVTLAAAETCGLANFQQAVIAAVNQARAAAHTCGTSTYAAAAPLAWNAKIFADAAAHSRDMAVNNYFSHTGLDGSTPGTRLNAAGYSWSTYGENIAWGQSSVASVMAAWMGSAGHCANIMNSRVTEFALACVRNASGRPYWTMVLARPRA